jgi:hypothetical protein
LRGGVTGRLRHGVGLLTAELLIAVGTSFLYYLLFIRTLPAASGKLEMVGDAVVIGDLNDLRHIGSG